MNFAQVKKIPLVDFLNSLGTNPISIKGNIAWYLSPFHEERTPSFKIDLEKNLWYDFSIGRGGNICDFVQIKYETTDPNRLLSIVVNQIKPGISHFSFQKQEKTKLPIEFNIAPLTAYSLKSYLKNERYIDIQLAENECCELHWIENTKNYYAIAFANNASGYEIRTAYGNYKRCIGKKSVTLIKQQAEKDCCCVFEGFMDYLSFLTHHQCKSHNCGFALGYDYLILNSVALVDMAINWLKNYSLVYTFLDNDSAGLKATEVLKTKLPNCISLSEKFAPYKDFNEWHISNQRSLKKAAKKREFPMHKKR